MVAEDGHEIGMKGQADESPVSLREKMFLGRRYA
jgi:hypothetical protein